MAEAICARPWIKGSVEHSVERRRHAFNASNGGRLRGRPLFCCRLSARHKKAGSSHPAPCADEPVYRLTDDEQESSNAHPSGAAPRLCGDLELSGVWRVSCHLNVDLPADVHPCPQSEVHAIGAVNEFLEFLCCDSLADFPDTKGRAFWANGTERMVVEARF